MLTRKESAIVQVLLRNDKDYVSSQMIAKEIGMSDRTVRTYLQKIGDKLEKKGATLSSQSGRGYCLSITDEEQFQSYWQQADKLVKEVGYLEEAIDRRHYIIHKLFLEAASPTLLELAEELYLSKTSISQILTEIKEIIVPYHLQLSISRKGITIIGEETAIRHFIKDYFFMDSFQHSIFSLLQSNVLEESQFSDIILIVVEECRKEQLQLPDFVLHNLVVHLALMMSRIRLGKKIAILPHQEGNSSLEYNVARNILTRLSNQFSIHFPREEADYIVVHLQNRTLLNISENITSATHRELTQYLEESLDKLGKRLSLPLQKDTHLLDLLQAHFIPFLHRLQNAIQMVNPLKEDIIQQYPDIFEMVKESFSDREALGVCAITDDEYAYITLHVLASLEKRTKLPHYRILVVCASGYGSARMLKNRIENEFSSELEIVDIVSYWDLTDQQLEGIDFIISAVDLSHLVFLIPVVQVSVLLPAHDIQRIRSYMRKKDGFNSKKQLLQQEPENTEILMKEAVSLLQPEQFLYIEKQIDKEQLFSSMIQCLEEGEQFYFQEEFRKQIEVRENLSSLVYNEVLAFPHPPLPMTQKEQVVVAVCRFPIQWDEAHDKVQFIFLLSPSTGKNKRMKSFTASLASFAGISHLQEKLLENPTVEQLKQILLSL